MCKSIFPMAEQAAHRMTEYVSSSCSSSSFSCTASPCGVTVAKRCFASAEGFQSPLKLRLAVTEHSRVSGDVNWENRALELTKTSRRLITEGASRRSRQLISSRVSERLSRSAPRTHAVPAARASLCFVTTDFVRARALFVYGLQARWCGDSSVHL